METKEEQNKGKHTAQKTNKKIKNRKQKISLKKMRGTIIEQDDKRWKIGNHKLKRRKII